MKRILMVAVCLVAAVMTGYFTFPDESKQYVSMAVGAALPLWENVRANPIPVFVALGTFVLTVVYHKAKGKTLRESVEVAATRVTVVSVHPRDAGERETPVVKRAWARTTRTQLLTDQIGLQCRQRKLPEEVRKAEKEACYAEHAVADAERALAAKVKVHNEAAAKLEAIRKEKAECEAELAEIDVELNKLTHLV
jgi:hypothetical protein